MNWSKIPFLGELVARVPHMDYEGQRLAERINQLVIVQFAVVGFVWGYLCQQFVQTIYILGAGVLLSMLLMVPPWPVFRKHPLPWQQPSSSSSSGSTSGTKKREKRSS